MPVKVVPVTSDELKAYAELMRGNTSKKPKDFCEYLKGQHRSKVDVIADLSGVTFSELNLRHIDLGNIIACKKDEHPTQFQECVLEGTKFRSTQPAEGLAFTDCKNMKNASFEMDLMGVNFGKDSDITGVDFRKAHNIDKVIIDPACVVSAVQLDFPNADILKAHMGVNIQKQREAEKAAVEAQQQAELFRGYLEEERNQAAGTEETARVQKQSWGEYLAENLGATPREVVVNVAKGVARGAKEVVVGNARLAAEAAGDIVGAIGGVINTPFVAPASEIKLHENAIDKILKSGPQFSVEKSRVVEVTKEEVQEWIASTKGTHGIELMSLAEFLRASDNKYDDKTPYLRNLDLKNLDFSGLELGDVVAAGCDFTNVQFKGSSVRGSNLTDCNFAGAVFSGADVKGADLSRSDFTGAMIAAKTDFTGAKLSEVNFSGATISDSVLKDVDMKRATFADTAITASKIENAQMQGVKGSITIKDTVIDKTNFTDAQLKLDAEKSKLTDCIAHNAVFKDSKFANVTIEGLSAQGINMSRSDCQYVHITKSDLSHGIMTGASLTKTTIKDSTLTKLQADFLNADHLTISGGNAQGINLHGGKFKHATFDKADMQHADMTSVIMEKSTIKDTTLHGSNLSGEAEIKAQWKDTKLEHVNATDVKIDHFQMEGGAIHKVDMRGVSAKESIFGTEDKKVEIKAIKADIVTNFVHSAFATVDPKSTIAVDTFHGGYDDMKPADLVAKHEQQEGMNTKYSLANLANASGATVDAIVKSVSDGVSGIADSLKTYKKSRMGMVLGVAIGVAAGVAIAGIAASTFGLGLIPIGIVAAVAIGTGAIGGGIAGNMIQHTNTGRGILTMASAGLAAMALGPVGLVAAPAMMIYNAVTNHKSPIKSAVGSVMDTFIAKPLRAISGFMGETLPSIKEVKEAQRSGQLRNERNEVVAVEKAAVNAIVVDPHAQIVLAAQHAAEAQLASQVQEPEVGKKKNFANRVVHKIKEKIMPKKKPVSFVETVQEGRDAPTVSPTPSRVGRVV